MAKTAARNPGRPSDYLPEYVDQAAKLCRLGATDAKIADFFEKEWRATADEDGHYSFANRYLSIGSGHSR